MADLTTSPAVDSFLQSLTVRQMQDFLRALNDAASPLAYTSPNHTVYTPHGVVVFNGYVYIWDRAGAIGCKINPLDFSDITYYTTVACCSVCDGGDGYIYGVSELGTRPIIRFDPTNNTTTTVVAAPAITTGVGPAICSDALGSLYITSSYDANNTRVLKYTIGSWGGAAVSRNIAKKNAHAINYIAGSIWLSGYDASPANGWWGKLNSSTLADIIAPVDFAPGGGEMFGPTDDFTWDNTHAYFISEMEPVANAQFARINLSTGAVNYYNMPGGVLGASYAALWDGGTNVIVTQFNRNGVISIFDTLTATFSEKPISVFGPINEIVLINGFYVVTTYQTGDVEGGLISRLRIGDASNGGKYFNQSGDFTLEEGRAINDGPAGVNFSYQAGDLSIGGEFNGKLRHLIPSNETLPGLKATSLGDGTNYKIQIARNDDGSMDGDEGSFRYLAGFLGFEHADGDFTIPLKNGNTSAIVSTSEDYAAASDAVSTNTTLSGDQLAIFLPVGAYILDWNLFLSADVAGGHKYQMGVNDLIAGLVLLDLISTDLSSPAIILASRFNSTTGGPAGQTGASVINTRISGIITVTTEGFIGVKFAKNVGAGGNTTLLAGSYVKTRTLSGF